MPKFLFVSEFAETLDLAMHLKYQEGQEVLMHIASHEHRKIGEGLIDKIDDWYSKLGQGYIWVFDSCCFGKWQGWLRSKGEFVFGGSEKGDALENDRQLGQKLFKSIGFEQPESKNFTDIEEAIKFVEENSDRRWILKQNGGAPKHLNHMGKFEESEDMLYHLKELKKAWNEADFGPVDFDLMEIVEGQEVAASALFNGEDLMRDKEGRIVGWLNFEHKKECDGDLGETTGELGTVFYGTNSDNEIFDLIINNEETKKALKEAGFRGIFDINGCLTEDGDFVGFEPTCRFGVPSTSFAFTEGLETPAHEVLEWVSKGLNEPVSVVPGLGMVMVVAAKPFPLEAHVEESGNSLGERLWPLEDGQPKDKFSKEQMKHIHLYNFSLEEDIFKVATDSGYMLTVTGKGKTIGEIRENLIYYIKDNLYLPGMKWRSDIGEKLEESGFVEEYVNP